MKNKIIFLLMLFPILSFGQHSQVSFSDSLQKKEYYFSALNEFFIETYDRVIIKDDLKKLEDLLYFTGIELLDDYEPNLLKKYPTSSTKFVLGRQSYHSKKFKNALDFLSSVHPDHRYFPEAKLIEAEIHESEKNMISMRESYLQCQKVSEIHGARSQTEKIERYYKMIHEICLANVARNYFDRGEYKEAIGIYDKISKRSYKWPFILLEKAWSFYHLGDYNRALGLLTTYKSPLLSTYFFPEAEYLAALIYFKLCLYEDSLTIIKQFYQVYRPRFQSLDKSLKANRYSKDYFYHLMLNDNNDHHDSKDFVKQILVRMKKQIRYSLDFNAVYKIENEIKRIHLNENKNIRDKLLPHLLEVRENIVNKINYNAKSEIFQFLDSIPFLSQELFKLNLEIISRKKDLVYTNKKLVADRSRGDYSNVSRSRFDHFWKFEGAFWADELGDYSMGLKSNCEKTSGQNDSED